MKRRSFRTTAAVAGGLLLLIAVCAFTLADSEYFQKISRGIDVFGRVYREVALNYVDQVDPEKFMESGIDGMLSSLDPYTNFISASESDEVELITAGKYGGIGVTIGLRDGFITILTLMEGYSAERQGLLPGDRILEVDGKNVTGIKPQEIRSMTRGVPGSELHLKIGREGEPAPLSFTVVREEIQLKNCSYADFIGNGIAYIHLERFSRGTGDEVRQALGDLRMKGTIRGVILDLRDNPGGLLDEAVDVVEKFAPKGSLVVSTRGRTPEMEKKYYVAEEPTLPETPLVVLVNRGSASASEIVAGAIQDLDRGIILGTRTFGKGLVQTITPLIYNTQLKITTAKYYTPSGRCIQEIDYSRHTAGGVLAPVPDSLRKSFRTLRGRIEYEAGGIQPDSTIPQASLSPLSEALLRRSLFFAFATQYSQRHPSLPLAPDDSLLDEFRAFCADRHFTYQDNGTEKLLELDTIAERLHYSSDIREAIGQIRKRIADAGSMPSEWRKEDVMDGLKGELISRYRGEHGRIEASLRHDLQVQAAIGLLENRKQYTLLLSER